MRPCPRGLAPMLLFVILAALAVSDSSAGQQRVVCYYTNWSVYRPGNAKFNPQNINPYLCTHLIYAFGGLTKDNGLRPFDKYQDIEQGGYAKFNGLKSYNKQLKTMLAIGGWNEGSTRFSPLVADSERRTEFVKNVVRFLRQNHFDGLDLDWEYPAFRDGGKSRDRANYAQLVQELRAEFDRESSKTGRERLLLTMAVPAGTNYVDKGYDVPSLNRNLDFMNILSYDYHSAFEPVVNHHAPLYSSGDPDNEYNFDADLSIEATIKHYVELGADRDKLVLGIPTYGRSYTLFNPLATEVGSAADGPGEQGDATREKGYLAYYEICEAVKKSGWTVENPRPGDMGPIAYKDNQWVGYDDEEIVRVKARYVAAQGLGGIMFWSIDNDDFRGKCHDRPYPLIEAGKEALLAATKSSDGKRTKPASTSSTRRQPPTSSSSSSSDSALVSSSGKRRRPSGSSSSSRTSSTTSTTTPRPPNLNLLTTPEPPTTPDPGSDFVCKDEGFFPHPRDCKKYFWCLDSGPSQLGIVAHQFTCPSGLVFNKQADSCDYARNVICNKNKAETTTTTSTTSTTAAPVSSTRSPLFRPVKTTTTTTTTPAPEEEEYDEEEYEEEFEQEDPKAIKELLDLIKRLGGVEQLEKQFGGSGRSGGEEVSSVAPERPNISKSLYQRVLSGRSRISNSRGPAVDLADQSKPSSQSDSRTSSFTSRSRGPQNQGLENLEEVKSLRKEKPKYVEIRRPVVRRPVVDEVEDDEGEPEEEEIEEEAVVPVSRPSFRVTSRPNTLPKYTSIRRSTTPAAPRDSEEEEQDEQEQPAPEEQPKRKYVSLNRPRPTVDVKQREQQPEEEEEELTVDADKDQDEVPALVLEVAAPRQALEFEGRVEEIKQKEEETTAEPSSTISSTTSTTQRATAGFFITRRPPASTPSSSDRAQRVFVVNAVPQTTTTTTTTTEKLPETTLTTEPPVTTILPLTTVALEENTEAPVTTQTPTPVSVTTQTPVATTSTITRVVTSITESPIFGRTIILVNRKLNFTLSSLYPTTERPTSPTSPMTIVSETTTPEETEITTIVDPVEISTEPTSTTTAAAVFTKRLTKRPTVIRRRPFTPKTQEKTTTDIPKRRRIIPTRNSLEVEPTTESSAPIGSTKRTYKKRARFTLTSTTEAPVTSAVTRRRFRPTADPNSSEGEDEQVDNQSILQPSEGFRQRRPYSTTEAAQTEDETDDTNIRTAPAYRIRRPSITQPTELDEDNFENSNLRPRSETLYSRQRRPSTTSTTEAAHTDDDDTLVRTSSVRPTYRPRRPSIKQTTSQEEVVENINQRTLSQREPSDTFRSRSRSTTTEANVDDTTSIEERSTLRTPSRRRKIIRYKTRTTTTTEEAPPVIEEVTDDDDDPRVSASGNEVFLLSSSQSGPNPDEVVDEENDILSSANHDDDHQLNHFEVSTTTTSTTSTAAPVVSTSRPAVTYRPLTRRPFSRARSTTTTTSPDIEEVSEDAPSSPKPRVQVVRRKFRPYKNVEKSSDGQAESSTTAATSSPRSSLIPRRRVLKTSTTELPFSSTTAVGETSPLLSQQSPAVYYTRQPLDELDTHTEVVSTSDHDLDLANVAVAALTNLATSPPSALSYDDDFVDEESVSSTTTTTTTTSRPTSAPRKTQRVERLPQPKPFTRITSRGSQRAQAISTSAKPLTKKTTTTSQPSYQLDFEDYYDDENPPLNPQVNKVKIHEDGSLECLDRGNFAHPFSCRKFISCALMENGALLGWIYTCPKHLAFDPIGGICNWSGGCKE